MKVLYFFEMCAYVLGLMGGLGWALYNKAYLISISIIVLGIMAFPELKRVFKNITS